MQGDWNWRGHLAEIPKIYEGNPNKDSKPGDMES